MSALHEGSDNRSILDILKDESAKSNRKKRSALIYREGRNSKSWQTTRLTSLPIGAEKTINGDKIYAGIYFGTQFSKTPLFATMLHFHSAWNGKKNTTSCPTPSTTYRDTHKHKEFYMSQLKI